MRLKTKSKLDNNNDFIAVLRTADKNGNKIKIRLNGTPNPQGGYTNCTISAEYKFVFSGLKDILILMKILFDWLLTKDFSKNPLKGWVEIWSVSSIAEELKVSPLNDVVPESIIQHFNQSKEKLDDCIWVCRDNPFQFVINEDVISFDLGKGWSKDKIARALAHWLYLLNKKNTVEASD